MCVCSCKTERGVWTKAHRKGGGRGKRLASPEGGGVTVHHEDPKWRDEGLEIVDIWEVD